MQLHIFPLILSDELATTGKYVHTLMPCNLMWPKRNLYLLTALSYVTSAQGCHLVTFYEKNTSDFR